VKTLEIFTSNIRKLRLSKNLTQQALSEKGAFGYKYYQSLETGRKKGFTFSTMERLADALGVEPWKLLHPDIVPKPEKQRGRSPRVKRC